MESAMYRIGVRAPVQNNSGGMGNMKIEYQDLKAINQDFSQIHDPLENIKVASALNSEIFKFNYRKEHAPKEISPLDFAIIAALMRQIPMKPKRVKAAEFRYTDSFVCPECGGGFTGTGIANHCYHCGQKLDWGNFPLSE